MAHGEASGGPVLPPQRRSLQQRFGPHARARDGRGTVRRLLALYARWGRELLLVVCLTLLSTGAALAVPYLLGRAVDCFLPWGGVERAALSVLLPTLAGAAAAMLTGRTGLLGINRDKTVGWLSGEDTPALRSLFSGFSGGAQLIDPEIRVINAVAGSFTDARAARGEARRLLDQGADVLALAAGAGNEGALAEARERGIYIVGLDTDQAQVLPGHVLTSILKRADRAVYEIVADASRGNFQGKKIITYDLSNDGVGITDPRAFTAAAGQNAPPDLERRLKDLRAELLSGSIRLKSLRARTLCDCL